MLLFDILPVLVLRYSTPHLSPALHVYARSLSTCSTYCTCSARQAQVCSLRASLNSHARVTPAWNIHPMKAVAASRLACAPWPPKQSKPCYFPLGRGPDRLVLHRAARVAKPLRPPRRQGEPSWCGRVASKVNRKPRSVPPPP